MRTEVLARTARMLCVLLFALLLAGCGGGLAGSTYQAEDPNGGDATATLTFVDDQECKLAMGGPAGKFEVTTTYSADKDSVTIESPMGDDDPLVLTRAGNSLVGELDGDNLTFVKQ